ncbi:MAG TPA: cell wall-binding repeat-containing protein [Solirubrobacteraceae bacterium]|nr:cell wall-binding repeat-containing protein [Solirubrobacteraceae bacterium]
MRRTAAALTALVLLAGCGGGSKAPLGHPKIGAKSSDKEAATELGFPSFATANTTRVGGADATADAAAVARAVYPGGSPESRPPAVTLVDASDWRAGVAASVLMAHPLGAPVLLSDGATLPPASEDALNALQPTGAKAAGGAQVIRIGAVATPSGYRTAEIAGRGPFALAHAIDAYVAAAHGSPSGSVLVVSSQDPEYAMPAAGWAAKSGDPVLFTLRDRLPAETRRALAAHDGARIYVLGPPSAVSGRVLTSLRKLGRVTRIAGGTPVTNAVAFARFADGGFGWGVTDPGHGFVFVNGARTMDAVAAAPLSASGSYGPLLLLDSATQLAQPLRNYLLDVQPGYTADPVRGVYNHGWIVGDAAAISLGAQARLDELLRIVPVSSQQSGP